MEAWFSQGQLLENRGRRDEAAKCYQEAVKRASKLIESVPPPIKPILIHALLMKATALQSLGAIDKAEQCFKETLRLDAKNVRALGGLSILYSEYRFEFDRALKLSLERFELEQTVGTKGAVAENYIELGEYEKGREYALESLRDAKNENDEVSQCFLRFFVICSRLLSGQAADSEVAQFFDYYSRLKEDFRLDEPYWTFRGLIHAIKSSKCNVQTIFLLVTLIDLMQGRIDRRKLSLMPTV